MKNAIIAVLLMVGACADTASVVSTTSSPIVCEEAEVVAGAIASYLEDIATYDPEQPLGRIKAFCESTPTMGGSEHFCCLAQTNTDYECCVTCQQPSGGGLSCAGLDCHYGIKWWSHY